MNQQSNIFLTTRRGMAVSTIVRTLQQQGQTNIVIRTNSRERGVTKK